VADASWGDVAQIELAFARSRRRAQARRRRSLPRHAALWPSAGIALLTAVLFALLAEPTRVEGSNASRTPARAATPEPRWACPLPARFRPAFVRAAARSGLPLALLAATAYEESRMNPAARSDAGAQGLLQLMPATARELRLDGADPASNVLAGALYLRQMLARFGTIELALAAYNAGPTAVMRARAAPTIETLRYAKNVEARAELLAGCR
jgi:soluble lytic murein transglycosylase-like protein